MASMTGTNLPDLLFGTIAADTLRGLLADDILYGFDGNDLLQGGSGDDTLHGGSGNDRMDGGAGEDFFYGGSGIDTVSYLSATAALVLDLGDASLSTGDAEGDVFTSIERFELTQFSDLARGTSRAETIFAGGGNDTLFGLGGNDSLRGEAGNDRLIGGAGADTLNGGAGTDVASYEGATAAVSLNLVSGVFAGEAAGDSLVSIERLVLSGFADTVTLAGAIHYVDAGAGQDTVFGAAQADTILGGAGRDVLFGYGGNDLIVAGNPTLLLPGQDEDSLYGGSGSDTLRGGTGTAFLFGGAGDDRLLGEAGNDTLNGGSGADLLHGGDGIDTVIYDSAVTLDLGTPANSTGAAAGDVLTSVEVIAFTSGSSTYLGSSANMTVRANGAQVVAHAGSGAETFHSMDVVSYAQASSGVTLTASSFSRVDGAGGAAGDVLFDTGEFLLSAHGDAFVLQDDTLSILQADMAGGDDTVEIQGELLIATLLLGDGADTVLGYGNDVTLTLGAGNDQVTLLAPVQSDYVALVFGGADDDTISITGFAQVTVEGGAGNDAITAGGVLGLESHIDLTGGAGDDTLFGAVFDGALVMAAGDGDDVLTASARVGTFEGNDGADQMTIEVVAIESGFFTVDGGAGNDMITLSQAVPGSVGAVRTITVMGGAGDDVINGSGISQGMTAEGFEFRTGWGDDTISGFDLAVPFFGDDALIFRDIAGLNDRSDLAVTGDATHVVFSFGGQSVRLDGIDVADAADVVMVFV